MDSDSVHHNISVGVFEGATVLLTFKGYHDKTKILNIFL